MHVLFTVVSQEETLLDTVTRCLVWYERKEQLGNFQPLKFSFFLLTCDIIHQSHFFILIPSHI